jgi:hypothetical protein
MLSPQVRMMGLSAIGGEKRSKTTQPARKKKGGQAARTAVSKKVNNPSRMSHGKRDG